MKKVLLVGLPCPSERIADDVVVETRGLCRQVAQPLLSAAPLYDYDVVVLNPASFSHFLLGSPSKHSSSDSELWGLKRESEDLDFDTLFDLRDRANELDAALRGGTRVICVVEPEKREHFFGWRSSYAGYLRQDISSYLGHSTIYAKLGRRVEVPPGVFAQYFSSLGNEGWTLAWNDFSPEADVRLATTPENYLLGAEIRMEDGAKVWFMTPPPSERAVVTLISASLEVDAAEVHTQYHGIFLSHSHEDKEFVRELQTELKEHGVDVWVDEAEIKIGDSLMRKLSEGIARTEYFGIVLSPQSVGSNWVNVELAQAMQLEIDGREVKVLPLLYQECELPLFLRDKLYADFTTPETYRQSVDKLLRRLEIT